MREIDLEHMWDMKGYRNKMNMIKDSQLAIGMAALLSWPRFATYKEDEVLRNNKKWESHNGYWQVLWDMTNISAKKVRMPACNKLHILSTMQTIVSRVVSLSNYVDGWVMKTCRVVA